MKKPTARLDEVFYRKKLQEIGHNPNQVLKSSVILQRMPNSKLAPGKLYLYSYEPKGKETLPWWDRLPLLLLLKTNPTGFSGINLHYFPWAKRMQIFDSILPRRGYQNPGIGVHLKLSGLAGISNLNYGYKNYLRDQVKSKILLIHPVDWMNAVYLPMMDFQKKSKEHVWSKS